MKHAKIQTQLQAKRQNDKNEIYTRKKRNKIVNNKNLYNFKLNTYSYVQPKVIFLCRFNEISL